MWRRAGSAPPQCRPGIDEAVDITGMVPQPRLTRIADAASSAGTPMAVSTWEGFTLPLEQADPALTAIPARSKAMIWVSLVAPGIDTQEVLATLGAARP